MKNNSKRKPNNKIDPVDLSNHVINKLVNQLKGKGIISVDDMYILFLNAFLMLNQQFIESIDLNEIRKEFNIPKSDKLKRNGYWSRNVVVCFNGFIIKTSIRIQKLQWTKKDGTNIYISRFPDFIIKYRLLSTIFVEFLAEQLKKDGDINLEDPQGVLFDIEYILRACKRIEAICNKKNYPAELSSTYYKNNFCYIKVGITTETLKSYMFPALYLLYKTAQAFKDISELVFSFLNKRYQFIA